MSVCPFIHKEPSAVNCANCCFYVYENLTNKTYCAILLSAERSSNIANMLTKNDNTQ